MGRQPGHRQRGAGTVTVSKGDVERQGVLCKEWQRTPTQLLHEYCQSKKRRNAFYPTVKAPEGRFRVRCVLPDDKNSAKDLKFCPTQDFETLDDAKHCAALLALQYLEPLRPLERKLPDPYRDLWLAMTTAAAAAPASAGKAGASGKKSQAAGASASAKKGSKTEASAAAVAAPATSATATASDASDDTGMDLWGNSPDLAPAPDDSKPKKKALPVAITADRAFASHAELEQAKLARVQERNKKQRARENRERANVPKQVFMSAACREMIESVLRSLGTITTSDSSLASDDGARSKEEDTSASDSDAHVTSQLQAIGFDDAHVRSALQACVRGPSDSESDFMTRVLDWLCLHVPEGELPKGFNPEGTQLDVVRTAGSAGDGANAVAMSPVLVQRLMKYGYDRRDAVAVVNAYLKTHPEDAGVETPTPEILFALLQALYPHQLAHFGVDTSAAAAAPADADEIAAQRQDEVFALEAIYDDRFALQTLSDAAQTQLVVLQVSDDVQLELFLPSASQYPYELPVLGLTTTNAALQPFVLFTAGSVLKSCANALGEPMIYDMCVAVDTILAECAHKASGPKIVLMPQAAADSAKPERKGPGAAKTAPPPAPTPDRSKSKAASKRPANKKPRRVDPEAVQRLSDSLAQARERKANVPAYQQMQRARAKLPAAAETRNVIELLEHHQVLLVCGQTGCGKTTQVPQFILDDYIQRNRGGECNIVCTQPRRIAAIGVATRVAQERCEDIADVVGYQIRMEAKKSAATRLLFCTTGVLLRRLLSDRLLTGVSHIIVDEVHERNIDTDFLLSILRDLLPKRPDLRLILMSATMNAGLFVNYFASTGRAPCPVLDIPGFTFPVQVNYLDDILSMTSYDVPKKLLVDKKKKKAPKMTASGTGDSNSSNDTDAAAAAADAPKRLQELSPLELAERIDDSRIDYDLVAHLVTHLVTHGKTNGGAILVFLPGTAEIKRLIEMLTHASALASQIVALPLHGSLSGADQALVFRPAPPGKTKIIASTNIAETSITINDITVVVDCGKVKEMVYDNQQRRSQLLDCWAAQAACDQRKGRAGRVQAGTCYRVFSRKRFSSLAPQLSAEIHRVSLEQLCLQIKKLDLGSIKGFLAKAIEPPAQAAIDAAMAELVEIAAFKQVESTSARASVDDEEVTLTPLGSHLAMLPLDARIGKFLIYGSILRCIEPVAIIAACISSKSPFVMSMSDPELRAKQELLKKDVDGNWKSDHLLVSKVVERYSALKGQKLRRGFCKDFGLSFDTLESIADLASQYVQQLGDIGFYDAARSASLNANASAPRIVKAALCAGLYSNVAQVVYPEQKYFQAAHGVVTEDHDAKKIRYFIKSPPPPPPSSAASDVSAPAAPGRAPFVPRERVFLHPSSCNFAQTQYDSPWLLYTELVQTSKVFVRESTMVNPYALLLFGGALDVVHEKNILRLDNWIQFSAVARIGVLIKAIRKHLDELLVAKIENPALDIAQSELVSAISHLLKSEGM